MDGRRRCCILIFLFDRQLDQYPLGGPGWSYCKHKYLFFILKFDPVYIEHYLDIYLVLNLINDHITINIFCSRFAHHDHAC